VNAAGGRTWCGAPWNDRFCFLFLGNQRRRVWFDAWVLGIFRGDKSKE
jgi:hypothetical protein